MEFNKKTETDSKNKLMVAKGERSGEMGINIFLKIIIIMDNLT